MIRRPPRSTLFPYTSSSDLGAGGGELLDRFGNRDRTSALVRRAGPGKPDRPRRRAAGTGGRSPDHPRSEEHTSELQSQFHLVCRLLLEKKNKKTNQTNYQAN